MELEQARDLYRQDKITFLELDRVFQEKASKEEKQIFWKAPVYDRPNVIEGKSDKHMNDDWDKFLKSL